MQVRPEAGMQRKRLEGASVIGYLFDGAHDRGIGA